MKNKIAYVLLVIAVVLVVLSFFVANKKPLRVVEYDIYFEVIEGKVGVDVNGSLLTFGAVNAGTGSVRRSIVVSNDYSFPIEVKVLVNEEFADIIVANEGEEMIVEPGKNITAPIKLYVPVGYALGEYEGKARIEIYKLN